ncbi:DUF4328 domain-containing protein [Streptomyces sp. NPDC060184]|uniref:DUF4328 domain-containing protein n=1 Tax=Streptomyces sp. NPDC060184 TaxID=3347064 RepID=UPI00365FF044
MGGGNIDDGENTSEAPGPEHRPPSGAFREIRQAARAAQALIVGQTALQLALAAVGGTGSAAFRRTAPVSLVLFLGAAAAFLVWFLACRANAELLAPGSQRYTEGLTLCGFLVPVLWWIPVRAALDIRDASGSTRGSALIIAWWAAFVAKTAGSAVVNGTGPANGGFSPYELVAGVLAAVTAVLVIRRITTDVDAATGAARPLPPTADRPAV